MKETVKERREKVIEKYAHDFYSYISIGIDMSEPTILKMFEKFLTEILIADSPQGPEDVEPLTDICKAHGTVGCDCLKKKRIEEIKGWLKLRDSQPESIHVKMFYKINELVRRVNEGN